LLHHPNDGKEPLVLLSLSVVALIVSGFHPYDRLTWFLEITPILIFFPIFILTFQRFPLTPLAYRLIFIHALILILGAHYTYEQVPLGRWVEAALDLTRNHYDRLGHFAQGFVPAILARELLLRRSPVGQGRWLFFLVTAICLAISAAFELVEWAAALALGADADAYLATQGDPWDTQWDMFLALIGAISSQLLLIKPHNNQLEELTSKNEQPA
jgi:putative membrane protein